MTYEEKLAREKFMQAMPPNLYHLEKLNLETGWVHKKTKLLWEFYWHGWSDHEYATHNELRPEAERLPPVYPRKGDWVEFGTTVVAKTDAEQAAENALCNTAYLAKKTE